MINTVVDGICLALNAEFGDDYKIYTESIEQGLEEPCFFVQRLNNTSNLYLGKRYWKTNSFVIQYFPSSADLYSECSDVSDRLFECLEVISLDDDTSVRGSNMESNITDEVLTFTINYNFYADKTETQTVMEEIDINEGVKT